MEGWQDVLTEPVSRLVMIRIGVAFLFMISAALGADRSDIDFAAAESLPQPVWDALSKGNSHAVETRLNPFYLQGDFDGDGRRDAAVLVKEKVSGKHGIAFVFNDGKVKIAGAGKDYGDGDNLDWMDAWHVERGIRGDAIMAMKVESGGGLIAWDHGRFLWSQAGD
jgi:hypothetical protein